MTRRPSRIVPLIVLMIASGSMGSAAAQSYDARFYATLNVGAGSIGQDQLQVDLIVDPDADVELGTSTFMFTFNAQGLTLPSSAQANAALVPGADYVFHNAVSGVDFASSSVTLFGASDRVSVNVVFTGAPGGRVYGDPGFIPDNGGALLVRFYFDIASDTQTSQLTWILPPTSNATIAQTSGNTTSLAPGAMQNLDAILDVQLANQLIAFGAAYQDRTAALRWEFEDNTHVESFEVLHRADSTATWSSIGAIDARKQTPVTGYLFETQSLELGRHFFKLLIVGSSGVSASSEVIELEVVLDEAAELSDPYPNPASSQATLLVAVREPQQVDIRAFDLLGRQVMRRDLGVLAANQRHRVVIPTSRFASGLYFVIVSGESFVKRQQMVVTNVGVGQTRR